MSYLDQLQQSGGWGRFVYYAILYRYLVNHKIVSRLPLFFILHRFSSVQVPLTPGDGINGCSTSGLQNSSVTVASSSSNFDAGASVLSEERNGAAPGIFRRSTATKSKVNKNLGDRDDDVHVCVSCLRAIMNNKVLFFRDHFVGSF